MPQNVFSLFNDDSFSAATLTNSINKLPYRPGRIGQLGLFSENGITTTRARIEERSGTLRLLPTQPRGAPSNQYREGKRKSRDFDVPHVPYDHTIYADELQDVRAFGSADALQTMQQVVNDRMGTMVADHEVTLEHLRMGAIQGKILDADGTEIHDLFVDFGVSQQTESMALGSSSTDVRAKAIEIARMVEDELGADQADGYRAFCGRDFFDALIGHSEVKSAYERWESGAFLRDDVRGGFPFGGIQWEEYRGKKPDGTPFVANDEAYIFPTGTGIFVNYFAPGDFLDTVNTIGLPRYARLALDAEAQRWARIITQSNPLPLNLRPRTVVKATRT